MAEKPILFSGEMVRAIREGRKTQTRRVVKPQPPGSHIDDTGLSFVFMKNWLADGKRSPYGKPGDTLWVRETWASHKYMDDTKPSEFTAGAQMLPVWYRADGVENDERGNWRPSIFMPHWASRINLLVTGVRAERVQDISDGDIAAEGIEDIGAMDSRAMFAFLWNSINGKRPGCSWSDNPWVWVVEFERVTP